MKLKKLLVILGMMLQLTQLAWADGGIKPLNQMNYHFELTSSPVAIVVWMNKSSIDDYTVRMKENLRDLVEFYQFDPNIKIFTVDTLREPMLTQVEKIKNLPTVQIYKFGQKFSSRSGLLFMDDLLLMIDDARFH